MGLTVAVGLYAQNLAEDQEQAEFLDEPFDALNEVLTEQGMPVHEEPKSMPHDQYFEAQMWGYGGLHALRRLAAFWALQGALPPPGASYESYTDDPTSVQFGQLHEHYLLNRDKRKILGLFGGPPPRPKFQHLVLHSDAEGFYLPMAFDEVIVDFAQPQRPGLGMMIGSSAALLKECNELAVALGLPDDVDPESDDFLDLMYSPNMEGPVWQAYPVEAHSILNLMAACRASLQTGAVIQFT
jgi:hypothetical protein